MNSSTLRAVLLTGAASILAVACSDTDTASPGDTSPIVVNPSPTPGPTPTPTVNLVNGSCPTGTTAGTVTTGSTEVTACLISGEITSDLVLTSDDGYALSGAVFVGSDTGSGGVSAQLTIPAGTTIFGATGEDYLVVTRGSRLNAVGTQSNPIIFTSAADIANPNRDDSASTAEWGGLVLNGFAPINNCNDAGATPGAAGCEKAGEGSSGLYGGGSDTDDSGTLRYIQVRYAGNLINNENELNGIAFQGVGNGTTVEFIQVHNAADDCIEFFGGTVNARYIVCTGAGDDNIDWVEGWVGNLQYAVAIQNSLAASDDPRGIEADNLSSDFAATPLSNPTVSNFTLIGDATDAQADRGVVLRRGTQPSLYNGIVTNWPSSGFDLRDAETIAAFADPNTAPGVLNSLYLSNTTNFDDGAEEETPFNAGDNNATGSSTLSGVFPGSNEIAVRPTVLADTFFDFVREGDIFNGQVVEFEEDGPDADSLPGDGDYNRNNDPNYIGAFGPTETVENNWASDWTIGVFDAPSVSCAALGLESLPAIGGQDVCVLSGEITQNLQLSANNLYALSGAVFIGSDTGGSGGDPAILTIDAGTTIFGTSGSDYLVVSRGSEIRANGTSSNPIVMTSRADIENPGRDDSFITAEWGGLVLNGFAPINNCNDAGATPGADGCEKAGEGSSGLYGGGNAADSSGNLNYVQVKYAGNLINNEDELNGVAFQGVGSATTVDFLHVHNAADDCIEFFGGTAEVKHVVCTGAGDDNIDWVEGWSGKLQYALVVQNSLAASDDPRGIEADNLSSDNTATPIAQPRVSHFTLIGDATDAQADRGMVIRRGTQPTLANGIVVNWPSSGFDLRDTATISSFADPNTEPGVLNSLFLSNTTNFDDGAEESTPFGAGSNNATSATTNITASNFNPGTEENNVTATDMSVTFSDSFFDGAAEGVDYIGAVEDASDTWYLGWTVSGSL